MVVATEFHDRRPRDSSRPLRRLSLPSVRLVYRPDNATAAASSNSQTKPNPNGLHSEYVTVTSSQLVQDWQAAQTNYVRVRDRLMLLCECTQRQAESLLQHVPGYLRYQACVDTALSLLNKPYQHWSQTDRKRFAQAVTTCVDMVEHFAQQVLVWEQRPERAQRLARHLPHPQQFRQSRQQAQQQWWQELSERRAVVRSHIHQAQRRLENYTQISPREKSLARVLERFAPLEDFPNMITNDADALALQTVLQELEPLLTRLRPNLDLIRNTYEKDMIATTVAPAPEQSRVTADTSKPSAAEPQEHFLAKRSTDQVAMRRAVSNKIKHTAIPQLGQYELLAGDSVYDTLMSDKMFSALPILRLSKPAEQESIVLAVLEALESSPAISEWIGLPYPIDDMSRIELVDGERIFLQLDRLHDLVTLVASEYGAVTLPPEHDRALRNQLRTVLGDRRKPNDSTQAPVVIQSVSDLWPALRAYFRLSRDSSAVHDSTTTSVVDIQTSIVPAQLYKQLEVLHAHAAAQKELTIAKFYQQAQTWADTQLLLLPRQTVRLRRPPEPPTATRTLGQLTLAQVDVLSVHSAERQRWLRLHAIADQSWRSVVRQLRSWQHLLETERYFHTALTVNDVAVTVYALNTLQTSLSVE